MELLLISAIVCAFITATIQRNTHIMMAQDSRLILIAFTVVLLAPALVGAQGPSTMQDVRPSESALPAEYYAGLAAAQAGNWQGAESAYRAALQKAPSNPDIWYKLGVALGRQNRYSDAISAYREAVLLNRDHADSWHNLGLALSHERSYRAALDAFVEVTRLEPTNADAWQNRGRLHFLNKEHREAIDALQKALRLKPDNAQAWFELGYIQALTNDEQGAGEAYARLKQLDPAKAGQFQRELLLAGKKIQPQEPGTADLQQPKQPSGAMPRAEPSGAPSEAFLESRFVWKDQASMEKANTLGKDSPQERLQALIACIVPSGTKVQVDRIKASYVWAVTVLEGQAKGCQGVVGGADFKTVGEREKSQRQQKLSECQANFDKWIAAQPSGVKTTKLDLDRAIGRQCSDLLSEQLQQEKQRAAREAQRMQVTRADLGKAHSALEPLQTLRSVTQVGVNYHGYLTRLGDAKIAFDQAVRGMGDSPVRDLLLEAMRYYTLAADAWNGKIQGASPLNYAEGDSCPALRALAAVNRRTLSLDLALAEEKVVGTIFSCASAKVAEAERWIASADPVR